ncbi:probable ribonuclease ZC3H12D isoform X2 [Antennarius striatus]|uniref:probable ribonuclease ZC3H12D isoform X2 n=1 Tax=Antennarius striatus TaxID=241820 RepID=UPI0035B3E12A
MPLKEFELSSFSRKVWNSHVDSLNHMNVSDSRNMECNHCSRIPLLTKTPVAVETRMNQIKDLRFPQPDCDRVCSRSTMEHQEQQGKVERFLKLGYSRMDILRVLESLHHDAQTNDILEELIKTCHTRTPGNRSVPSSPKLVSRGCSPCPSPARAGSERDAAAGFRRVVIDGSNVAMSHGDKKVFSCQGIQLAVNWFWDKGIQDITVFIPMWRKEQRRTEALITDQHVLHELEKRKILVYTPSRNVDGKRVVCYDDRYIVKHAFDSDGIIVSNDNYRDLQIENPQWKKFIEDRLLMYTFANDKFMPPDDPLGRNGPTIHDFLRKKPWTPENRLQHCPYGKKCTYGVKCKFYHPERTNQSQLSVADELRALSDRAKSFSPKSSLQDGPRCAAVHHSDLRYISSTPPPLSVDDPAHRASPSEQLPYQRDTSSPRGPPSSGCHLCPVHDADEAFSSMESSVSRLYIHDLPPGLECPSHSVSSGVASYSRSHDDYSPPGSFSGGHHRMGGGGYYPFQNAPVCSQCRCSQQTRMSTDHPHQAWSSCPALPLQHRGQYSDQWYLRPPSDRHRLSLPRDPWVQGGPSDSQAESLSREQRKGLRSQLSTLFPQSIVEHVMSTHPHISDMSQLISLMQSNRTSHISF